MSIIKDINKQVPFWEAANDFYDLGIVEENIPYNIKCPFHSDDVPSMRVYKDGYAFCFGCGKQYGSFDVLLKYKGNVKEAIELAKEHYNLVMTDKSPDETENKVSKKKLKMMCSCITNFKKDIESLDDCYQILKNIHKELQ